MQKMTQKTECDWCATRVMHTVCQSGEVLSTFCDIKKVNFYNVRHNERGNDLCALVYSFFVPLITHIRKACKRGTYTKSGQFLHVVRKVGEKPFYLSTWTSCIFLCIFLCIRVVFVFLHIMQKYIFPHKCSDILRIIRILCDNTSFFLKKHNSASKRMVYSLPYVTHVPSRNKNWTRK